MSVNRRTKNLGSRRGDGAVVEPKHAPPSRMCVCVRVTVNMLNVITVGQHEHMYVDPPQNRGPISSTVAFQGHSRSSIAALIVFLRSY